MLGFDIYYNGEPIVSMTDFNLSRLMSKVLDRLYQLHTNTPPALGVHMEPYDDYECDNPRDLHPSDSQS